ncbi:MAG: UDP-N-acetylmuramate dehydrogenase [Anaerolineae bacterium]|nr:UDP-N-acetylmuramate dehydrogenase [Anaerolineae bacterium]
MDSLRPYLPRLQANAASGKYTAARIGGPADWLYVARSDEEELLAILRAAWADGLPVRVIGAGANVLISDEGVRGLLIVNRLRGLAWEDDNRTVTALGGTSLLALARACAQRGLSGFEWAVGVPGTLGGALVNNAGAHGRDLAANLLSAEVLLPDGLRMFTPSDLAFAYRNSALKQREDKRFFVRACRLRFAPASPQAVQARMDEYSATRRRTQPAGASLGSVFKNPLGDYAGRLIESCGLKGFTIGGAQVSPVHANFFLNTADCTARDYFALIEHVQATVQAQTGVLLELEIERLGAW